MTDFHDPSVPASGTAEFAAWRAGQLRALVAKTVGVETVEMVRHADPVDADSYALTTGDGRVIVIGGAALRDPDRFARLTRDLGIGQGTINARRLVMLRAVLTDLADGVLETAGVR